MAGTRASDFSALRGAVRTSLVSSDTAVSDLSPLAEGKVNRPLQTSYTALLPLFGDSVS